MSTPQINVPMAIVAGFIFNVNALIAIDVSIYKAGDEGRMIFLYLLSEVTHEFTNERADEFYLWYLQFTGQARITPATPLSFTRDIKPV